MTDSELITLRDKIIEKEFSRMNKMQFHAVTTVTGPVLVLAGAGSGKTTVLVNRIAYMVKYGNAYKSNIPPFVTESETAAAQDYLRGLTDTAPNGFGVSPINPREILAITFTNKAANELKERIGAKLGTDSNDLWAGTFHSVCGKILRRYAAKIDYTSHFTIYDTSDQQKLMKDLMKQENIDEKYLPHRFVLKEISSAKDKLITPEQYAENVGIDPRAKLVAKLYKRYNTTLINNDAMDFDDMICNTVKLLKENADVLEFYQNKFKYIMVDEYQDTNHAQYVLIKLLADKYRNICAVGDDDQSIYHFRGATIENILNFEDEYRNSRVIRLEQNYRSTGNILNAANSIIKHNNGRKGKNLWTENGEGDNITVYTAANETGEAGYVADSILESVKNGGKFSDTAILYRTNAQSRAFENVFARSGITYKVIGGTKFFDRKEIKDVISYLAVINNPYDDLRVKRIINEPKRGIGETTVNNAQDIANQLGISLLEVIANAYDYPVLSRAASKLTAFAGLIAELRQNASDVSVHELLEMTIAKTGYLAALQELGPEEHDRIDNINELSSGIILYEDEAEEPTLSGYLEDVALVTDIDSMDNGDSVVLMTIHSAKGLEFNNVYIVGMEEGIFPSMRTLTDGEFALEEERRLAYVAVTRARKKLCITNATERMLYGCTNRNRPSRFIDEMPKDICTFIDKSRMYGFVGGYGRKTAGSNFYYDDIPENSVTERAYKPSAEKDTNVYSIGMRVYHKAFGEGIVLNIKKMADDSMLEIAFDKVGTKKLMTNFAKLKII